MGQYMHTLIAANSRFFPQADQIERFFELLTTDYYFRIISGEPFQPGLRIIKPSGRFRTVTDQFTGETWSIPGFDRVNVDTVSDVRRTIEGLEHYSVLASGEWPSECHPMRLLTTDASPFDGSYLCEASCQIRPKPVSKSCWNEIAYPNVHAVPHFAECCEMESATGIFSHPWTGKLIEVPNAGCARFWIEFEFGKFLLPQMTDSLNLLNPPTVSAIEECFETGFVQGWRFN